MFDIRHMRHLVAIADEGTLQKASERLNITQPALSKSVQALETYLDATLFERAGRSLRLTDLGREVVAQGRIILRSVRDTEELVESWRSGASGHLAIGLGPAYTVLLTAELVEHVLAREGSVQLQLETGDTPGLMARLLDDTIQMAVCDLAVPPVDPDIVALPLKAQTIVALVRRDHPLCYESIPTMQAISRYPIAHSPAPAQFAQVTDGLAGLSKAARGTVCLSDHYQSLIEVSERSDLVTLLPINLAEKYRDHRSLAMLALPDIPQKSSPKILYRRHGRLLPPIATDLIQHIQSIFAEGSDA